MAKKKSPGPDGLVSEMFQEYWEFLGEKFTNMIQISITSGSFPTGMTRGHIVLIPKGGNQQQLTNWHSITLLNVAYKIVAKVLQLRL